MIGRRRPLRGDRGPERLRQDLAADDAGRAARAERRHGICASAGRSPTPIPSRVGVIFQEASLFPVAHRARQHRVPAAACAARAREERRRRAAGDADPGRPRRLRRALSARAVGRHEAARLDRARAGAGSAGAADGRAVRRARRADAHDHGPRAAAHLVDHPQDRGVRHPQPHRGGLPRRRGAGDVGAAGQDHRPHRRSRCRARAPTR